MKRAMILLALLAALVAIAAMSCSSESAETQALYLDAKKTYDDINNAFTLTPNSEERSDMMFNIMFEKWDIKVVENLEKYLKESPKGKYATEAKALLEEAKGSMTLRNLGRMRETLQARGVTDKAQLDSLRKAFEEAKKDSQ